MQHKALAPRVEEGVGVQQAPGEIQRITKGAVRLLLLLLPSCTARWLEVVRARFSRHASYGPGMLAAASLMQDHAHPLQATPFPPQLVTAPHALASLLQHLAGRLAGGEADLEWDVGKHRQRAGRPEHSAALSVEAWCIKPAASSVACLNRTVQHALPLRNLRSWRCACRQQPGLIGKRFIPPCARLAPPQAQPSHRYRTSACTARR